jgi:hypothetical protein
MKPLVGEVTSAKPARFAIGKTNDRGERDIWQRLRWEHGSGSV